MASIFDNGTSLGHEILEKNMVNLCVKRYIDKGRHHIRWQLSDKQSTQHSELLVLLAKKYPLLANQLKNKLNQFDLGKLKTILTDCTSYKVSTPLTEKRAEFVFHLIKSRYLIINEHLEKLP